MVNSDKSIFEYNIPPYIQAAVVLAAVVVFILVTKLCGAIGIAEVDGGTPWLIIASMSFFFALGNAVMSLAADDQNKYFLHSLLSFVGLVAIGGGIAYLFSGQSMDNFGSFRWLFVLFAMGHVFFLLLIRTMRKIVKIAQKQDSRLRGED